MAFERMRVFTGNANPKLAEAVCRHLNISLGRCVVGRFSDGEVMVELLENVRGRDIFILQSTCAPTNDNLMEILVMTDALKRASAGRITAAIPYFGYARQDRRPRSARVPITAKVVADMLTTVGVNRVMVMDLHADQIQGFFNIPVDNIYATPILLGDLWKQNYDDLLVVSPDVGGVVRARAIAKRLDSDLAIIDKRRPRANVSEVMNIIGDVDGRTCVIMDDIVDTANTLCKAATALKEHGAKKVVAYCTHPVLSGGAVPRIAESELDEIVVTDTIPLTDEAQALPAHPPALLRAAPRRDDDARLERGVGELAVHRIACREAVARQAGWPAPAISGYTSRLSPAAGSRRRSPRMSPTADDRPARPHGRTAHPEGRRHQESHHAIRIHRISRARPKAAGASRRMRRAGKAPGIVYGGTAAPQPIELDHNALFHALRNEAFHASILTMKLDGARDQGAAARRADASVPERDPARRLPARRREPQDPHEGAAALRQRRELAGGEGLRRDREPRARPSSTSRACRRTCRSSSRSTCRRSTSATRSTCRR